MIYEFVDSNAGKTNALSATQNEFAAAELATFIEVRERPESRSDHGCHAVPRYPPRYPAATADASRPGAGVQGSEVSLKRLFQNLLVQGQLGHPFFKRPFSSSRSFMRRACSSLRPPYSLRPAVITLFEDAQHSADLAGPLASSPTPAQQPNDLSPGRLLASHLPAS